MTTNDGPGLWDMPMILANGDADLAEKLNELIEEAIDNGYNAALLHSANSVKATANKYGIAPDAPVIVELVAAIEALGGER